MTRYKYINNVKVAFTEEEEKTKEDSLNNY